jgi:hypothetical protein
MWQARLTNVHEQCVQTSRMCHVSRRASGVLRANGEDQSMLNLGLRLVSEG